MKRTLLLTLEYPPQVGGVAHYYANIVRHLPNDTIFVLDNQKGELLSTSRFVWPKWIKGFFATYRAIRAYDIECIFVGQILPLGTIAWFFKRFMGIPYIVATHGMDVTLPFGTAGSRRKQRLIRLILKNASAITTVSLYTRDQLVALGVPEKKVTLVYPCANEEVVSIQPEQRQLEALDAKYQLTGKRVVLSVGRLVERKGFDLVIASMNSIQKDHPDVVYVIVGEGEYRARLEELIRHYALQSRVLLVGKVSQSTLAQWYTRATSVVMPSRTLTNGDVEGFGIAFLEANMFGKPVIGGKSGGIPDAVVDGETGFLVDPTDLPMLTKAIVTLLDNSQLASRLGANGAKRAKETFNWVVQAKKLEECITRI